MSFTRRNLLQFSAAGLLTSLLPSRLLSTASAAPVISKPATFPAGRPLRVAHLTDMHLMDGRNAAKGFETAIQHALDQKIDLILQGGDALNHSGVARDIAKRQMALIEKMLGQAAQHVPVVSTAGNHDVFDWKKPDGTSDADALYYGKAWFQDHIGQGKLYSSQPIGSWQLITLDSVRDYQGRYRGGLDDEQFAWLKQELETLKANDPTRPVIVMSHIPILCMGVVLLDGGPGPIENQAQGFVTPRGSLFNDAWRVVELFRQHGNVKAALSGHVHIVERIDLQGTSYLCNGAVCGSWWMHPDSVTAKRNEKEKPETIRPYRAHPGYALLNLNPDGTFTNDYIQFPWKFA